MWRLPLILNTLLMLVFGFLSGGAFAYATNEFVTYRDPAPKPLPSVTIFAVSNGWIALTLPSLWILLLFFLLWRFRAQPCSETALHVHAAATLLFGVVMLSVFLLGAILPFVSLTTRLSH